jgi:hydroxymethylglutaryl-CoA reductase (NADPH)
MKSSEQTAAIPMRSVGPVKITGAEVEAEVCVPLATYESPLWPSVARGARVSMACGGIRCRAVVDERMSRSVLLEAPGAVGGGRGRAAPAGAPGGVGGGGGGGPAASGG